MDLLERLVELRRRGEAVAMATIVASRAPTSARPGDRALVLPTGELVGWVGGSCAQPTVQREGLRALADGRTRLVRLSPEASTAPEDGVVEDVMTCHSGGSLEIYVEPFLLAPALVVTGDSPVADALATLGDIAGYRVSRELPDRDGPPFLPEFGEEGGAVPAVERYVVVAGMSSDDEVDLERALALAPRYLALVGSRKRLVEMAERLRARGVPSEQLARIKGPAGLDIGAATAPEIAISIMAEIVVRRRGHQAAESAPTLAAAPSVPIPTPNEAIDPICGMRVAVPGAQPRPGARPADPLLLLPGVQAHVRQGPSAVPGVRRVRLTALVAPTAMR